MSQAAENRFRVLIVCTANVCRSPIAEGLLRQATDALTFPWTISSAGTRARAGRPMDPLAAAVLRDRGVEQHGWSTQPLTAALLDDADLVLTATAEHRGSVVQMRPATLSRTFLLQQFARYASAVTAIDDNDPVSSGPRLLERCVRARGALQPVEPGSDDLADPLGRPAAAFRACADRVDTAIKAILLPLQS